MLHVCSVICHVEIIRVVSGNGFSERHRCSLLCINDVGTYVFVYCFTYLLLTVWSLGIYSKSVLPW